MSQEGATLECPRCRSPVTEADAQCPGCEHSLIRMCYCGAKFHSTMRKCPSCNRATRRRRSREPSEPRLAWPGRGKRATRNRKRRETERVNRQFATAVEPSIGAKKRNRRRNRRLVRLAFLVVCGAAVAGGVYLLWPRDDRRPEDRWFERGRAAAEAGDAAVSLDWFRKCVDARPDSALFRFELGRALVDTGDRAAGLREVRRARNQDRQWYPPLVFLGEAALEDGDEAEATKLLLEAAKRGPPPEVYISLGKLLIRRGRVTDGIEHLVAGLNRLNPAAGGTPPVEDAVLAASLLDKRRELPGDLTAAGEVQRLCRLVSRWCLLMSGEGPSVSRELALARAKIGLNDLPGAVALARRVAGRAQGPDRAEAMVVSARIALLLGSPDLAAEELEEAKRADPGAATYLSAAEVWRERGITDRYVQALDLGRHWLPDSAEMLVGWARGFARSGPGHEALRVVSESEAELRGDPAVRRCVAEIQRLQGMLRKSREGYETLVREFPGDDSLERERVAVLVEDLMLNGSVNGIERDEVLLAARRLPGDHDFDPWNMAVEGMALVCEGRSTAAEEVLGELCEQDPVNVRWQLIRGYAEFAARDYESASDVLGQTLDRTGASWPHYRRTLVQCYYRLGMYRLAAGAARELLARNPDDVEARWLAGRILLVTGAGPEAAVEFAEASRRRPEDPRLLLCCAYARLLDDPEADITVDLLRAAELSTPEGEGRAVERATGEMMDPAESRRRGTGVGPASESRADAAAFLHALGFRKEAQAVARQELERSPRSVRLRRMLSDYCFEESGDFTPVTKQIAALERLSPDEPLINYLRGQLDARVGKHGAGAEVLARYCSVRSADWGGWLALARARTGAGKHRAALESALTAWKLRPARGEVRRVLLDAIVSEAERIYEKRPAEELLALVEEVLGYPPSNEGGQLWISGALLQAVRPVLTRLPPEGPIARGWCALGRGDPKSALGVLERAEGGGLREHLRGLALLLLGREREALAAARRAAGMASDPALPMDLAMRCLDALGRGEEALALARAVVDAGPGRAVAHAMMGTARQANEDPEGARESFGRALELDPGMPWALQGSATEGRLRERVLSAPNDAYAAFALGRALERSGRSGEAIPNLTRAVKLNPRNREAHLILAQCLREEGVGKEAEESLDAALALDPLDADALFEKAFRRPEGDAAAAAGWRRCLMERPEWGIARLSLCRMLAKSPATRDEARFLALTGLASNPEDPQMMETRAVIEPEGSDEWKTWMLRAAERLAGWSGPEPGNFDILLGRRSWHRPRAWSRVDRGQEEQRLRQGIQRRGS